MNSTPILSLQACILFGLITCINQLSDPPNAATDTPEKVISEFQDVFSGIGRLNRVVKIQLKENAIPHVAAPRKVPLALHDKVKAELNMMIEKGIIVKVVEPTEWVSNMVVVD